MRMKTLWMHLPAPRCFRPLQRTIHLGCRTRSWTIFKHFIFNSLILPRKETSMPSVIANGTQETRLLHGGLQLDFADALCESLSTRTQHKKTSKNHRSSPKSLFLPLLRHPCRRCNLPTLCVGEVPCSPARHHWHLAFLDPGSWVLPPAIGHVSTTSAYVDHGLHIWRCFLPTCIKFPPTLHPCILDLVQHHVANANEAGHSLSASGMACVFTWVTPWHYGMKPWKTETAAKDIKTRPVLVQKKARDSKRFICSKWW